MTFTVTESYSLSTVYYINIIYYIIQPAGLSLEKTEFLAGHEMMPQSDMEKECHIM